METISYLIITLVFWGISFLFIFIFFIIFFYGSLGSFQHKQKNPAMCRVSVFKNVFRVSKIVLVYPCSLWVPHSVVSLGGVAPYLTTTTTMLLCCVTMALYCPYIARYARSPTYPYPCVVGWLTGRILSTMRYVL